MSLFGQPGNGFTGQAEIDHLEATLRKMGKEKCFEVVYILTGVSNAITPKNDVADPREEVLWGGQRTPAEEYDKGKKEVAKEGHWPLIRERRPAVESP